MNRKDFLRLGGCCAALAVLQRVMAEVPATSPSASAPPPDAPPKPPAVPLTPAEDRVAFTEKWAKRFFDVLDANLDEKTRTRIMHANGRACHEASLQNQKEKKPAPTLDEFIRRVQAHSGKDAIRREGDMVYFSYSQNPRGLKVADGYCLCPLVETGPKNLSKTYCLCSVGYVQHVFEGMVGHPVKVELVDSLRLGGKSCSFKVNVAASA